MWATSCFVPRMRRIDNDNICPPIMGCYTHCYTQTALSEEWDTMGVAWVVRDSLSNASGASAQSRKQLVNLGQRTFASVIHRCAFRPTLDCGAGI